MDTSNLSGRTVLVTGAGSGIGRATALLCAQRGADLAICDIDDDGLAETERQARESGHCVLARHVDVAEPQQMRAFAEAVHAEVPAVDLLVNNAGVGLAAGVLDTELEDWDWIVSINLMGVVHGLHFFVPRMVERGAGGHIANLASMAGYFASPSLAAYTMTKYGVLGLSEALRAELQPHGIGVTAICPGAINTPITVNVRARGASDDPVLRQRAVDLYQRRGYTADRVARNILKAIERNRAVAPIALESWLAYGMKRAAPRFVQWVARRSAEMGAR